MASHLRKKRTSLEKATVMAKNKIDAPVVLSTDEARAGVTGHHVRYVHAFGTPGDPRSIANCAAFLSHRLLRVHLSRDHGE